MTKLLKFGFEIEGEFSYDARDWLETEGVIKSDGSVKLCRESEYVGDWHKNHRGADLEPAEYNSPVYTISSLENAKAFFEALQKTSDNGGYHWNKSSGFHIHTSYSPKKPPEIMSEEFVTLFLTKLKEKFPTEYALREGNRFCEPHMTEDEIYQNNGNRYHAVNIMPALDRHGTIEFRIFPTAEPMKMFEFLEFTLSLILEWIKDPKLDKDFETKLPKYLRPEYKTFEGKVLKKEPTIQIIERIKVIRRDGKSEWKEQLVEFPISDVDIDKAPEGIFRDSFKVGRGIRNNDPFRFPIPFFSYNPGKERGTFEKTDSFTGIGVSGEWIGIFQREEIEHRLKVEAGDEIYAPENPFNL